MIKYVAVIIILFFSVKNLQAQCTNPPNGVDCTCSTAQILCTPDLLDGFTFSMSTTNNLGGYNNSNSDLCPGLPDDGVPNNVNWFSFIAWCTDLDIDIQISNCSAGGNFPFFSYGVQIALFSGCPIGGPLFCETDGGSACGTAGNYPTLQTLSVSGLTIGDQYYFMLDGCAGSACDITLDVIGTCGTGTIDPWTTGLTGPLTTCVGNTDTYIAEDLNGAVQFYYTLDGVPLVDGDELTSINTTWNTAGTYELCVDVGNDPCIPVTNPPDPFCITVMVCDAAEAGSISAASPYCPGDIANITVSGEQMGTDHDQYIIITDATGVIVDVVIGNTTTWTSDICEEFVIFSYNVKIGNPVPTIGMSFPTDFPCDDNCCDIEALPIAFEDFMPPTFDSPPASVTLDCFDELVPLADLAWTDDCMGTGTIAGSESGTADACDGGSITRTWTVTDSCGNSATHDQVITINPTPPSDLVNPPADETITCDLIPTSVPNIDYINTGVGQCALSGTIIGTSSGTADLCGGTITNTWADTDACGNSLSHTQVITVDPVPEAVFINPPASTTVTCEAAPTTFPDLDYDNGESGACSIIGSVSPVVTSNYDVCGGSILLEWSFTDACGRAIDASQTITVDPAAPAVFTSTLPSSITVDCDAVPAPPGALSYSNAESGACLIDGIIDPIITDNSDPCGGSIVYEWEYTDMCGRSLSHTQTVTINPALAPTFDMTPVDITLDCTQLPLAPSTLNYSNGLTGICDLSGSVTSTLTPFDPCTGVVTETWNDTDACGNVLNLSRTITISPIESVVFDTPPADITVSCEAVPSSFPSLNFSNGSSNACLINGSANPSTQGSYDACGGELIIEWQANDGCGNTINAQQIITVTPAPSPTFATPPADITVSCAGVPAPSNLSYSNGLTGTCGIAGSTLATQVGTYDLCGGNFNYEWTFIDPCGVEITAVQNITVNPTPEAQFVNLPLDITVNCEDVGALPSILNYTNNQNGACDISGIAVATNSGTFDFCGGLITQTWEYTDMCGRMISYERDVTVDPANDPIFINPPEDITLACGEDFVSPGPLMYSNGSASPCAISGNAPVSTTQNGITYTNTWEFIDPCTNTTESHVQNVTLSPIPEITIDPLSVSICLGDEFDLSSIIVTDQNNTSIDLEYYFGTPAVPGTELSNLIVSPGASSLYTIVATNEFNCIDEAVFTLAVDEAPFAGNDGLTNICDNITVDLFSLLGGSYDFGGTWLDLDGAGVNLDSPSSVLFSGQQPGVYTFAYIVESGNSCPNDTALVDVNFSQLPEIEIDSVYCDNGNTTYIVELQANGYEILPSSGTAVDQGDGTVLIIDIPIDEQVVINFFDGETFCADFVVITPPDCDCPQVPLAIVSDTTICQGDLPAILTAIAPEGTIINWYNEVDANTALLLNSASYTSPENTAGVFTYYLETESIEFPGCVSTQRVPFQLTIVASPSVTDAQIEFCIDNGATIEINFSDYNSDLNGNSNNGFRYFGSLTDAESLQNEIFDITLAMSQTFWVVVSNINDCSSIGMIDFMISNNPILVTNSSDVSCLDSLDGSISLDISPAGSYSITVNNIDYATPLISDLAPGTYFISVVDDLTGCFVLDTAMIEEGQMISENFIIATCQNNGTDTDASDDFYELNFTFSESSNSSPSFELFVGGTSQGVFAYGSDETITIPADGSVLIVEVVDLLTMCNYSTSIGPLNPCSTNCLLEIIQYTQTCDDNGTSSDPTDDSIVFNLEISSVNGSAANTYDVLINGNVEYTFMYNEAVSFELPADATTPNIILIDSDDNQCLLALDVLPLLPCSYSCDISILNVMEVCSDAGTEDDPSDDIITITVEVDVVNGGSDQVIVIVDNQNGIQQNVNSIEIEQPADGLEHWLYVQALDSLACIDSIMIGPFLPCSSDCSLKLEYWSIECIDNGTAFDPTDDFYSIAWMIQAIEGSPDSIYQINLDGGFFGDYLYSDTVFTTLPADNVNHVYNAIDATSSFCQLMFDTEILSPCSDSCLIEINQPIITCDNSGTNNIDEDDEFFAEFTVGGLNVGDCWIIEGEIDTYPYDQVVNLGPFPIVDGSIDLTILDCDNNLCPISIVLQAPNTCSECLQTIEAGNDEIIDCDNPQASLNGISSESGQYSWEGPTGVISSDSLATANSEGWYYFSAEYSDGCSLIDSLFVTANGVVPVANAGDDQLLTCDNEEVVLTGMNMSTATNVEFFWLNEAGDTISQDSTALVDLSGLYYFFVLDIDTGCLSVGDEVFVGLDIEEPDAMILADPSTILNCVVESVELSYNAEDNVIYQWTTDASAEPSDAVIYLIDSTGFVYLTATDTITGCIGRDTIFIESVEEFPIISLSELDTLTCDQITVILDATNTIPLETSLFSWRNELGELVSNATILEVVDEGIYTLEVIDTVSGCLNIDTVEVINLQNFPSVSVDDNIELYCEQIDTVLTAVTSSIDAAITWNTSNGIITGNASSETVTISGAGTYIVEVTDALTGCVTIDTVLVEELQLTPSIDNLEITDETCFQEGDGQIQWSSISGGTEPYSVFVDNTEIDEIFIDDLDPGIYDFTVIDVNGCRLDTVIEISAAQAISINDLPTLLIEEGGSDSLFIIINVEADEIASIVWDPDTYLSCSTCLNVQVTPLEDILYTITVTDINGCVTTTTVEVEVRESVDIYVPNIFSPDGDGINDNFTLFSPDIAVIQKLAVYNRWGELMYAEENFEAGNPNIGWDGQFKGRPLNPGVYVYFAIVELNDGTIQELNGDVTIVR